MTTSTRLFLQFFDPDGIVAFLGAHPVTWHSRELTRLHALADQAGRPPTSAIGEFYAWVIEHEVLPTQQQYSEYCLNTWQAWGWPRLNFRDAVCMKLERNFYISCIDQYHAFGLLAKAGWYDRCSMDSVEDMLGKADLTLYGPGYQVRVNLKGPDTAVSREAERYKAKYRGHGLDVVQLHMPWHPIGPGNKRWWQLADFAAIQPALPGVR